MIDLKGKTLEELREFVIGLDQKPYKANQIFQWIFKRKASSIFKMSNLSKPFCNLLSKSAYISKIKLITTYESKRKDTKKYLFQLEDGELIESVLMRYEEDLGIGRVTVCLSTQVGCRFGCKFCASGKIRFIRNLNVAEIIDQILTIQEDIDSPAEERISNIVFMGMGEPLDNYENLIKAIKIITCAEGISIGAKHIAVSTCGIPQKIINLSREKINLKLAISLHAAEDSKRSKIIPINKKYPLEILMKALRQYQAITRDKIIFEYALINNFNDSDEDIKNIAKLLKGIKAIVNIIPLNKVEGFSKTQSSEEKIKNFVEKLKDNKLIVTIRKSRGEDIEAACGQLRYHYSKKRGEEFLLPPS